MGSFVLKIYKKCLDIEHLIFDSAIKLLFGIFKPLFTTKSEEKKQKNIIYRIL